MTLLHKDFALALLTCFPVFGASFGLSTSTSVSQSFGAPFSFYNSVTSSSVTHSERFGFDSLSLSVASFASADYGSLSVSDESTLYVFGPGTHHYSGQFAATASASFHDQITILGEGSGLATFYHPAPGIYPVAYPSQTITLDVSPNYIPVTYGTPFDIFASITLNSHESLSQSGDSSGDVNASYHFQFFGFHFRDDASTRSPLWSDPFSYSTASGRNYAALDAEGGQFIPNLLTAPAFVTTTPEPSGRVLLLTGLVLAAVFGRWGIMRSVLTCPFPCQSPTPES